MKVQGLKNTYCGDWDFGWGLSGYNKIGKLYKVNENTFIWYGNMQGRHGPITGKYKVKFTFIDNIIEIIDHTTYSSLPVKSELIKSIEELKNS